MASAALSVVRSVSQQLGSLLVGEVKFLYSVTEKVEKLLFHLQYIQSFLNDIDRHEYQSRLINHWVFQIREFAYEVDNIMDKYAVRISRHHHGEGVGNILKWFSCVLCDAQALHEVGSDIDSLSRRISELTSLMQLCGFKLNVTRDTDMMMVPEFSSSDSHIEDDFIVGFDEDVADLVHRLVNTDTTNSIIVCGMGIGGEGKTTIAKMIYQNEIIKQHFDGRVWILISHNFAARDVLELLWLKLSDSNDVQSIKNLLDIELQRKIKHELEHGKYLVVLDDFWNQSSWNHIRDAFPLPQESCSKIMLTTRNNCLHEVVGGYLHHATRLTDQDCWFVCENASETERYYIDDEILNMAEMIIRDHFFNNPLLAATLGGILSSKTSGDEWRTVVKILYASFIPNGCSDFSSVMMRVLELSYKELPYYLKPLFLYLAVFPNGHEIQTKSLYHMWIAEGLVLPFPDNKVVLGDIRIPMETLAERYLKMLLERCIGQVVRRGKRGKIKSFCVHRITREMCIKKGMEENFLNITSGQEIWDLGSHDTPTTATSSAIITTISVRRLHRLAIHMDIDDNKSRDSTIINIPRFRYLTSLLLFYMRHTFPRNWLHSLIETSSLLRVLCLENARIFSLPKKIGNLIHLRYLSLFKTFIENGRLPSSIGNLSWLETLDLQVENICVLMPIVLRKLKRLRHLYLPGKYIGVKMFELHSQKQLETLKNLILNTCDLEGLSKLKALRKFTWTVDGETRCFGTKDRKMLERILGFLYSSSSSLAAKSLPILVHGSMLSQRYSSKLANLPVCEIFRGLEIHHALHSGGLDSIEILLQNMTSLSFYNNEFEYDPMPILERLPILSQLTLGLGALSLQVKKIVVTAGGFQQLTVIKLSNLDSLEEWEVERGSFPKLKRLSIISCDKLAEQPPDALIEREVEIVCKWGYAFACPQRASASNSSN